MTKLFIDTTFSLNIGFLNNENVWLDYSTTRDQKVSQVIHKILLDKMNDLNINIEDIDQVYSIAGPGSYTGTRLGAGISDLMGWQNYPVNSFYHYDIPRLCGIERGHWFCYAFKKEVFCYSWNKDEELAELVHEDDFENYLARCENEIYISEEIPLLKNLEAGNTKDLLKNQSKTLFQSLIEQNLSRETFYFRTAKNEYKLTPKS